MTYLPNCITKHKKSTFIILKSYTILSVLFRRRTPNGILISVVVMSASNSTEEIVLFENVVLLGTYTYIFSSKYICIEHAK